MLRVSMDTKPLQQKGEQFVKQLNAIIQAQLQYEGDELVTHARNLSPSQSYNDQTGNLRSSIGYATFANGRMTNKSYFNQVPPTIAKSATTVYDGAQKGEQSIENHKGALAKCSHGLIVVAGMEYAKTVEAKENKNVLARTELKAVEDIKAIQQNIKNKTIELLNK